MRTNTLKMVRQVGYDAEARRSVFKVLLGVLVFLFFLYMYLIGSITFNVLARKSLEVNISELGNDVSDIELEYIALSNSINAQFGKEIGFIDAKNTIFVSRNEDRVALR